MLINLDRSPERLAYMRGQLDRLGLKAERLAGVDGSRIDLAPYAASRLRPGEIGCFLSHRAAWQSLIDSDDERLLVLEDDVRLSAALPAVLADLSWLRSEGEIGKLDTSGRTVALDSVERLAPQGRKAHMLCGEHMGGGGYIVSRKAAERLLQRSTQIREPVDVLLFGPDTIADPTHPVVQLVPAAVAQEKRFGRVRLPGMQSLTRERPAKHGSVATVVSKELRRWLRKVVRFFQRLPSRIAGTRRYIRIPFSPN